LTATWHQNTLAGVSVLSKHPLINDLQKPPFFYGIISKI